jgi:hypothetical protein
MTRHVRLLFRKNHDPSLIGYIDISYLSEPQNTISQIGCMFLHEGTAISWKSSK